MSPEKSISCQFVAIVLIISKRLVVFVLPYWYVRLSLRLGILAVRISNGIFVSGKELECAQTVDVRDAPEDQGMAQTGLVSARKFRTGRKREGAPLPYVLSSFYVHVQPS
jgi:hypothetical protein